MYDMNNMKKMKKYAQLAPASWEKFMGFNNAAMADGKIPARTKELMASRWR